MKWIALWRKSELFMLDGVGKTHSVFSLGGRKNIRTSLHLSLIFSLFSEEDIFVCFFVGFNNFSGLGLYAS